MFQKKWTLRATLATVLSVSAISTVGLEAQAQTEAKAVQNINYKTPLKNTAAYYYAHNLQASYATPDLVISFARSSYGVNKNFYTNYYKNVEKKLTNTKGILTESAGSVAKTIIAINAIGKDPSTVAGYNLLDILADKLVVGAKSEYGIGISNAIYALIALDGDKASFSEKDEYQDVSRQALADYLVGTQFENGGFSWDVAVADGVSVDMTAMVLTALANFKDDAKIQTAIEKGLAYISSNLSATAGYEPWGGNSADTQAQVILALTENDMNPKTTADFIKNGHWAISNLLLNYDTKNHYFKMFPTDKVANAYTTSSGLTALIAYDRYATNKSTYYDVSTAKAKDLTFDTTAPSAIKVSSLTNSVSQITGTTEAYATVTLTNGSKKLASIKADTSGKFSYKLATKLKAGAKVKVVTADLASNVSKATTYTVKDVLTPATPKVSKVVTGAKKVTGTTTKGATVTVKVSGKSYKAVANAKTGKFSVKIAAAKKAAKVSVSAKKAGYTSKTVTVTVKNK